MFQEKPNPIDPALALRLVNEASTLIIDTETSGLDKNAFVVGWVFYAPGVHPLYVPVRHEGGGNILNAAEWQRELHYAFARRYARGHLTVGHNIAFDLKMAARAGVLIRGRLEDTMINEGLIDDYASSYSLSSCAERHRVVAKKEDEIYRHLAQVFGGVPDRSQMKNFWKLPGDDAVAVDYATGDGVTTFHVWVSQQAKLNELELRRVHQLECELIPYLAEMHRVGMRVDEKKAATIFDEIEADIKAAESVFPDGFNVNSPGQVEKLFVSNGYTDFKRTETGKPSFRADWLETNEIGQAILKVRQLRKARDSFITPLVDTYNVNGRVHPVLNQSKSDDYGAIGGRLSCSDPNMQAFPKRNKPVGKVVRQLIVPDEGMLLYESDFSQQEPRLMTHFSECAALMAGYNAVPHVDVHTIAAQLTGRPRDEAKRLGLGIFTGMGANGLAQRMGWPVEQAQQAVKQFLDEAFPEIRQLQHDTKATAQHRGYIRTLLGRRATFPDRRKAYTAFSRVIQGGGADHTKLTLLRACQFAEASGGIDILLTIHDSFIYQARPDADVAGLVRELEATAKELGLAVPIPVETGRGANWAEASYGEKVEF